LVGALALATRDEAAVIDLVALFARDGEVAGEGGNGTGSDNDEGGDEGGEGGAGARWRAALLSLSSLLLDAGVLKVAHCAGEQLIWLQRELGLAVVNCLDLFVAVEELIIAGAGASAGAGAGAGAGADAGAGAGAVEVGAFAAAVAAEAEAGVAMHGLQMTQSQCALRLAAHAPSARAAAAAAAARAMDLNALLDAVVPRGAAGVAGKAGLAGAPEAEYSAVSDADYATVDWTVRPLPEGAFVRLAGDAARMLPAADAAWCALAGESLGTGASAGAGAADGSAHTPFARLHSFVAPAGSIAAAAPAGAPSALPPFHAGASLNTLLRAARRRGVAPGCSALDRAVLRSQLAVLRAPPVDVFHRVASGADAPLATPPWYLVCQICEGHGHFDSDCSHF